MEFDGKTAVITGGARGIGRATASAFVERGATVVVADKDEEPGRRTAEELSAGGGTVEFRRLDVSDAAAFDRTVEAVVEEFGSVDVLFNNAGAGHPSDLVDTDLETRDEILDVNLCGVWNGCRAAAPRMVEQGGGAIVNMCSVAAVRGAAGAATYAAAKAGVFGLTQSLARELGRDGIRVNAVFPGRIRTRRMERRLDSAEDPEAMLESLREENALGRVADPEEVATSVRFLASEDASFVTGHGLVADGGALTG